MAASLSPLSTSKFAGNYLQQMRSAHPESIEPVHQLRGQEVRQVAVIKRHSQGPGRRYHHVCARSRVPYVQNGDEIAHQAVEAATNFVLRLMPAGADSSKVV